MDDSRLDKTLVNKSLIILFAFSPFASMQLLADDAIGDLCVAYNQTTNHVFVESTQSGNWNEASTWGGAIPSANDNVIVNHNIEVSEGTAKLIQIRSELKLTGLLSAYGSVLVCQDGKFSSNYGSVDFHVSDDQDFTGNSAPGLIPQFPDFHPEDTGLWVLPGGELDFSGETVTPWLNAVSMTDRKPEFLQKGVLRSLAFNHNTAKLAENPIGWRTGDTLLLVNERGESTLASITSITNNVVSYEVLEGNSSIEGFVLQVDAENVDARIYPKVANLSRRIQIIGADVTELSPNHRAHTAYLKGSNIGIRNVEFRNLGPRGKLGRYPLHWHHNGVTQDVLDGNSIWQSVDNGGNRFVTLHMASGVQVTNNVGFRSQGHGFFMEELTEVDNVISGNLSVDVRHSEELPNVDQQISGKTHHYWLRSGNQISGNVAAGNSWDGSGKGNHTPPIEGLVVLASNRNDSETLVSDFECLGCGGIGMWTAVKNTRFVRPVASYAVIAGFRGYNAWNFDSSNTQIEDPIFILNGNNELFTRTEDYPDSVPWASQIYLNYGAVSVSGGVLVGRVGIHAHYDSRFSLNETTLITNTSFDPTYWETTAIVENSTIQSDNLFSRGYGSNRRASPGAVIFKNTCLDRRCKSEKSLESKGFSGNSYASMFNGAKTPLEYATWVEIPEFNFQTGFIKLPENSLAKYWSVTPTAKNAGKPRIMPVRERESSWIENLEQFGGLMDGFLPGEYSVNLYSTDNVESLITSQTITVESGQISRL